MTIGIVFLIMPLIPGFGREINGAKIWVSIGSINFQPGEFAKIVLAIFFSAYIVEKRDVLSTTGVGRFGVAIPELRHLGPILLAWGVSLIVMVAEKDLGSSLLFFTLFDIEKERVSFTREALLARSHHCPTLFFFSSRRRTSCAGSTFSASEVLRECYRKSAGTGCNLILYTRYNSR